MMPENMKILVMKNDKEYPVTGENGKYWICGKTQFRKGNVLISHVKEEVPRKKQQKKKEKEESAK